MYILKIVIKLRLFALKAHFFLVNIHIRLLVGLFAKKKKNIKNHLFLFYYVFVYNIYLLLEFLPFTVGISNLLNVKVSKINSRLVVTTCKI